MTFNYWIIGTIIVWAIFVAYLVFMPTKRDASEDQKPIIEIGVLSNREFWGTEWHGWQGGGRTMPSNTNVVVMFRCGHIVSGAACDFDWWHEPFDDCDGDIVAWRVAD